jgi:putative transposase
MQRVAPSTRLREELAHALASGTVEDPLEFIARTGARLLLQEMLEAEVDAFLGRQRYQRGERHVKGYRNGYREKQVRTTAGGSWPISVPKLRQTAEEWTSHYLPKGTVRTEALEALMLATYVRGASTRDVEAALQETYGHRVAGKSTVSKLTEGLKEEYQSWQRRRLDDMDVAYVFLDAIYLPVRPEDGPAEGVLAAWGYTLEGRKALLGLALGTKESHEAWMGFLRDLTEQGLRRPALVIADGAPGLWKAVREIWPGVLEQRCLVHALRNLLAKVPQSAWEEVKAAWWAVFDGAADEMEGTQRLGAFCAAFLTRFPSMVALVEGQEERFLAHLRFPKEHHRRIRSTNTLERSFREVRRRTKVMGSRFPGEHSCLSLVWAVILATSGSWRGLTMLPAAVKQIEHLRRGQFQMPNPPIPADSGQEIGHVA